MAWGGNDNAIQKWIKRLEENDPTFTSLHILSFRQVSSADLAQLFTALGRNSTLKHLYCSGQPLDANAMESLSEALALNDTIESINVGTTKFGADSALFKAFCEGLAVNEGLRKLDLDNKGLTTASVELLAECLEKNNSIESLVLSRNLLDNGSVEILMNSLSNNGSNRLKHLDLSMNDISKYGGQAIAEFLSEANKLEELDISDNPLGPGGSSLVQGLRHNNSLRSLKLSGTQQDPEDFNLDQPSNVSMITSDGDLIMKAFSSILPTNTCLKHVWLDGVGVSNKGMSNFAKAIRQSNITELRMRRNNIEDEGVIEFAQALQKHSSQLTKLELGENAITIRGFQELLACPSIQFLGLFNNKINNFESSTFTNCPSISTVDIGCNGISTSDFGIICEALKGGFAPSLKVLEMGGNVNNEDEELELWEIMAVSVNEVRPALDIAWKRLHAVDDGKE
ncbi:hypothetical protein BGW37DRAFT_472322 [Umbelopsis sp. PMI_123]|nr:hypothetical protein BGW37DRAFT_472322 [Umbelopsis sp. PMI_123]